jgi:hypothetical protein
MLTSAQSNLAKLMATEDITVIQKTTETAYFDTVKRILVIPTWKDLSPVLIEMLIGHEIGHALYTDSKAWIDAISLREPNDIFANYLNVVEDARIESLVKKKYPGMKKIFFQGYKELVDSGFFPSLKNQKLNLIDRLNVWFKLSGIIQIDLEQEDKYWIDRISNVTSFEDVVEISIEIFDIEKSKLENKNQSKNSQVESESSDNSSSESQKGDSKLENKNQSKNSKVESESSDNSSSESQKGDSNSEKTDESNKHESSAETNSLSDLRSKTISSVEENLKEYVSYSSTNKNSRYFVIPEPNLRDIIIPHQKISEDILRGGYESKRNTYESFKKKHSASINQHKQLFEMRKKAAEHNKTSLHKTGVIDCNLLHTYKYNEDIFKSFEILPNGKKHGLVFVMDFSSSMLGYLDSAKKRHLN